MFQSINIWKLLGVLTLVLAIFFGGYFFGRKSVKVRTITKIINRERVIEKPVVRDSIVYKTKLVYKCKLDTIKETNTEYRVDTVFEKIPFEEKIYGDSTYTAQVSGYEPKLDWIKIHQHEIVNETVIEKNPHFSLTLGPSVAYGYTPVGWKPSAGVSLTIGYSLKNW